MIEIKKNWKPILFTLVVLSLLPIVFYVIQFNSLRVSNDPSYWGIFGNYLSGVLTPFFSLMNIIVLGYLAYIVSKHEDSSKLNDFRYKAYIELTTKLDILKYDSTKLQDTIAIENYLRSFRFNNLFLFDGTMNEIFQHRFADVSFAVTSLRIKLQVEEQAKQKEGNIHEVAKNVFEEIFQKELQELFDKFLYEKYSLVGFIQTVMLGGDLEPYRTKKAKEVIAK